MERGNKLFSQKKFKHQKELFSKEFNKNFDKSKVKCFNCIKKGHFARESRAKQRGKFKGRFHASISTEDEPKRNKYSNYQDTRKEYYLVSALFGSLAISVETWLVDSGVSKHMNGYRSTIIDLKEKNVSCHVELGDNTTYSIQGVGSTYFQLNQGDALHVDEILYVLKKKLPSISILEYKGFRVILWTTKSSCGLRYIFELCIYDWS